MHFKDARRRHGDARQQPVAHFASDIDFYFVLSHFVG
jgi:hypothetical protein